MWAVLVFNGEEVEFAPELHRCRVAAADAAERWAWILGSNGELPARRRGASEWMAGFRQVIVASVKPSSDSLEDPWVGLAWDEGCYPAASVEVVDGLQAAADWVGSAAGPTELVISPWAVASGITKRASSRRAVASKAKVVTTG